MEVEITNHKKVTVGSVKAGDVVMINDNYYLVLKPKENHLVSSGDEERTMLADISSGETIAPVNNVYCVVVKSSKLTLTF